MKAILTKPAPSSLLLDTIATCLQDSQLASVELELDEIALDDEFDAVEADTEVAPIRVPSASVLPGVGIADSGDDVSAETPQAENTEPLDILAAEDNETNQNYLEYILDDVEATYQIVPDGAVAVETWLSRKPRIILMDVSMPEMTGLEATQKIRELEEEMGLPRTPIVALTAHTLKGDKENCLEAGMDDYMSKPVSVQNVKEMLTKWGVGEDISDVG